MNADKTDYKCKICVEPRTPLILEGKVSYVRPSDPYFCSYHMLVMPKEHKESLEQCSEEERKEMDELTIKTMNKIKELEPTLTDFMLMENNGPHKVPHYHRHIIPNTGAPPYPVLMKRIWTLEKEKLDIYLEKMKF